MKCYNLKCGDIKNCDRYRSAACLNRKSKEQVKLSREIHGDLCDRCLSPLLIGVGKYSKKTIKICTNCGSAKGASNIA